MPAERDDAPAQGPTDEALADDSGVVATGCQKMDVLFVIDDSGSMVEEQAHLIASFQGFVDVLDASGLDYRVGVITTGRSYSFWQETLFGQALELPQTGPDGRLHAPAACGLSNPWIDGSSARRVEQFACSANVGTSGAALEMPLGAMRDAFSARLQDGNNAGFLRHDALLSVVILTDENDCSHEAPVTVPVSGNVCAINPEPVAAYADFLTDVKGDPSRWAVSVIAGIDAAPCSSALGEAAPATRLVEFAKAAGKNGVASSLCEGDLASGLGDALATFSAACDEFVIE